MVRRARQAPRADGSTDGSGGGSGTTDEPIDGYDRLPPDDGDTSEHNVTAEADAAGDGDRCSPINHKVQLGKVVDWEVRRVVMIGTRRKQQLQIQPLLYEIGKGITALQIGEICGPGTYRVAWFCMRKDKKTGRMVRRPYDESTFTAEGLPAAGGNGGDPRGLPSANGTPYVPEPVVMSQTDRIIPAEMSRVEQVMWGFLDVLKEMHHRQATTGEVLAAALSNAVAKAGEQNAQLVAISANMVNQANVQGQRDLERSLVLGNQLIAAKEASMNGGLIGAMMPIVSRITNKIIPDAPPGTDPSQLSVTLDNVNKALPKLERLDRLDAFIPKVESGLARIDAMEKGVKMAGRKQSAVMHALATQMGMGDALAAAEASVDAETAAETEAEAAQQAAQSAAAATAPTGDAPAQDGDETISLDV